MLEIKLSPEDEHLRARITKGPSSCGGLYRFFQIREDGKEILLHRFIMKAEVWQSIKFSNGDRNDFRRANLKVAYGVHFNKSKKAYESRVRKDGKYFYLGRFETENQAELACQAKMEQLYSGQVTSA